MGTVATAAHRLNLMRRSKEGAQILAQQLLDGIQFRIADSQVGTKVAFKALGKALRGTLRPPPPWTGRVKRSRDATRSCHGTFMAHSARPSDRRTSPALAEVMPRSVIVT